jgi:hypothetical protein
MQNQAIFISIFALFLTLPTASHAWTEPGLQVSSAFTNLELTNSLGTEAKFSSNLAVTVKPEITWVDEGNNALTLQGFFERLSFEVPQSILLNTSAVNLFGGSLRYRIPFRKLHFQFGLEGVQHPVADATNSLDVVLTQAMTFSLPVDLSFKAVVLERQVLWIGAGARGILGSSSLIHSGYSYNAHLGYELRGETRLGFTAFYEQVPLTTAFGKQKEINLTLAFRISFPGLRGLTPPPDERD